MKVKKNIFNIENTHTNNDKELFNFPAKQIYISESLKHFDRIKNKYNLVDYENKKKPAIFFGLYSNEDREIIRKHQSKIYILWGGTDIDPRHNLGKKNCMFIIDQSSRIEIVNYAISSDIERRLQKFELPFKKIYLNLTDTNLFKPVSKLGDKIYIYDGLQKGREDLYGGSLIDQTIVKFPEFKFLKSSETKVNYTEMPKIYKQCFIGVRLTKHDGNANTVQEMGAMGLPVIHNGDYKNCLNWETEDDIELRIKYRNLELFDMKIDKFKKILILCSDFPGYGGASTNAYSLAKYYKSKNKDVRGIFYTNNMNKVFNYPNFIKVIKKDQIEKYLKNINWKPDLVILRNFINFDIKKIFKCTIYFFIPGIFRPNLNCDYNKLNSKKMIDKFIHPRILDTISLSDESYCASYHSIYILNKFYGLDINILYFNLFPYKDRFYTICDDEQFKKRKYDFGIVISDFNRKIKNVDSIISKIKQFNRPTLLIGKNSSIYKFKNAICKELIHPDKIPLLMKEIKYIVQNSYYESCSNVVIEAKFNGCKIYDLKSQFKIENQKLNILKEFDEDTEVVGIYKVNPLNDENLENEKINKLLEYEDIDNDNLIEKIMKVDIYLQIILKLNERFTFNNIHYVYIKDSIPFNYGINFKSPIKLVKYIGKTKVVIWILNKYDQIFNFDKAKIYFLRGEYHNTFKKLCPISSIKIFYPAVSLIFSYNKKDYNKPLTWNNINKVLKKKLPKDVNYDVIMCHENPDYRTKYPTGTLINFKKWSNSETFYYKNLEREYIFCIVATSTQSTKNHNLFFEFFDYYDTYLSSLDIDKKKKIIYVTDFELLNINIQNRYQNLEIEFVSNLPSFKLCDVYNKSKINLIFSGRDACPRVISEAGNCGCFNIALDTLSDGKFYYDKYFGKIVGFSDIKLITTKSHSISYLPSTKLWLEIISLSEKEYNHKKISNLFISTFNEENFMNEFSLLIGKIANNKNIILNNNSSNPKVLITSTQYPHNGGSATTAYHTAKFLKKCGFQVACIFFENKNIDIDPENIGNVYRVRHKIGFKIHPSESKIQIIENIRNDLVGEPDIILGFNYGSPVLIRQVYNKTKLLYCISGIPSLTLGEDSAVNRDISIRYALNDGLNKHINLELYRQEKECIKISDLCTPYTKLIGEVYKKLYPEYLSKLIEPSNTAINNILINKKIETEEYDKTIDIIAVASNWNRKVKNLEFLKKIMKLFPYKNKVIIGIDNDIKIKNLKCINRIPYDEVQKLMKLSKIIIIPSYSESGPNVILEAIDNKCIPIASKNIGFSNFLNENTLCQDVYNIEEFYNKISYNLNNYYKIPIKNLRDYEYEERINFLNFLQKYSKKESIKPKILFVSCDIPNNGGAATNTYNMIRELKKINIDCYGLFISNMEDNKLDPNNLGNVYQLKVNHKLEENFKLFQESIDFNIVFFKNYKVFSYISHLIKDSPKIYSPSGLRYLTSKISEKKTWYQNINLKNNIITSSDKELKIQGSIIDFVKTNDKYLEDYVFKNADYIIPNSSLTYNLIEKTKKFQNNLMNPIYLTNINLIKKENLIPFDDREYDIIFIAYSWKRQCKNYTMVKKLIESKHIIKKKVVIVGKDQEEHKKVKQYNNLSRDEINKLLSNTKTLVIPSYYDSNPNVLVEGVSNGCNIVTSPNVGNYQFIAKELLVTKYYDDKEWRKKIYASLVKQYKFSGFNQNDIIIKLKDLFYSILN
ncbi:MAG: hypothetical protein CMF62_01905 [Magnetococcales bacterium]|nr:hypothetical protein [Magnetococcales bacterium]